MTVRRIQLTGGIEESIDRDLIIGRDPGQVPLSSDQRGVFHGVDDNTVSRRQVEIRLERNLVYVVCWGTPTLLRRQDATVSELVRGEPELFTPGDTLHYGNGLSLRYVPDTSGLAKPANVDNSTMVAPRHRVGERVSRLSVGVLALVAILVSVGSFLLFQPRTTTTQVEPPSSTTAPDPVPPVSAKKTPATSTTAVREPAKTTQATVRPTATAPATIPPGTTTADPPTTTTEQATTTTTPTTTTTTTTTTIPPTTTAKTTAANGQPTQTEPSTLTVSLDALMVAEGVGSVDVTATLDQPAKSATTVTFATMNDTAVKEMDFTVPPASTKVIAEHERSAVWRVEILNDDVDEVSSSKAFTVYATAGNLSAEPVTVTINDDDTAGVTVEPKLVTVDERESKSYKVKLDSEPTAEVTVTAMSRSPTDVTVMPNALTFTTSDWDTPQSVTVTGMVAAGDPVIIAHQVSSTDPNYDSLSDVEVSVTVSKAESEESGEGDVEVPGEKDTEDSTQPDSNEENELATQLSLLHRLRISQTGYHTWVR